MLHARHEIFFFHSHNYCSTTQRKRYTHKWVSIEKSAQQIQNDRNKLFNFLWRWTFGKRNTLFHRIKIRCLKEENEITSDLSQHCVNVRNKKGKSILYERVLPLAIPQASNEVLNPWYNSCCLNRESLSNAKHFCYERNAYLGFVIQRGFPLWGCPSVPEAWFARNCSQDK